ncbi:MAG: ABC transporter substrate-binding protein [Dehalococcoidia bacterium]|nr:ABC transporter substrate-binding protein [Dehalococcoidia bacterium]
MTTSTKTLTLKSSFGTYPHTGALKDGSVKVRGVNLDLLEITPITTVFRRMCRNHEFDIAELAITTYLAAKAYDLPFTAIPVFPVREYWHGQIYINTDIVKSAKDMEGKKVGVRAYTVTGGVWARGILAEEFGVDLDKITWVLADEEHVAEFHKDYPKNVVHQQGANIAEMLASGELAAAIAPGPVNAPNVKQLVPDAKTVESESHRTKGFYPINHTIVVKNDILAAEPWVAVELFNAFSTAKKQYLTAIKASASPTDAEKVVLQKAQFNGGDSHPYGVAANRKMIDAILRMGHNQHILPRAFTAEDIFPKNTLDLS